MLHRAAHPVLLCPEKALPDLLGFFIGVGHQCPHLVPKMLGTGNETDFLGRVDVDLFQFLGQSNQRAQVHVSVLMLGGPDHAFWTATAGEPDGRVGFLHRQDPGVNDPSLVVLAFEPERSGLSPAFDYQVVGLFEPVSVLSRRDSGLQRFHRSAPDETRD